MRKYYIRADVADGNIIISLERIFTGNIKKPKKDVRTQKLIHINIMEADESNLCEETLTSSMMICMKAILNIVKNTERKIP